ncbi:cell wall hydrolase [Sphingomonas aerophila]|uniref:Spore germination cell wall hydrolase CwlJ-like protein n=1 Tax=Sphingomonas aerophila TaxID=1344948 RepID=A0A7W9BDE2_9SPHN|nr:cell wall hydrolase [Sphingomonas aerophila]MBB5715180.1 spore germination cell wall hydrolase CwlJ-like protein [Sphingomonas aerophila]
MAPRSSRSSARGARDAAADQWLFFLLVVAGIAIAIGVLGPWPRAIEPPRTVPLTMAQARVSNAAVPVQRDRRGRAAPFRFHGGAASREQAAECLATAALYEAGDDRRGQRAVIQVILNRVRAPGFPKTVCGVVYQGHARATGCQFSFTCDGSIQRRTVHSGWAAARRAGRRALDGYVFAEVGKATHYHTDWMVPYWRDTLTKVARVDSHLFYVRS